MNITILTDLHIGKKSGNDRLIQDSLDFIDFVVSKSKDSDTVVINGDTFDNNKHITPKIYNTMCKIIFELSDNFVDVYFNLGNHDMCRKKSYGETMFDMFELPDNVDIISSVRDLTNGNIDFRIVPYGLTEYKGKGHFIFTHMDNPTLFEDDESFDKVILNGHLHSLQEGRTYKNLGLGYQLDTADADIKTCFHIIHEDMDIETIPYDKKTFLNIHVNQNKIDGEQPVKWLMANKQQIKDAYEIKVISDHETSDSVIEKFNAILETINASFVFVDSITSAEETKVVTNQTVTDTLLALLPETDSYKAKVASIYASACK